jgi:hypothetical protein
VVFPVLLGDRQAVGRAGAASVAVLTGVWENLEKSLAHQPETSTHQTELAVVHASFEVYIGKSGESLASEAVQSCLAATSESVSASASGTGCAVTVVTASREDDGGDAVDSAETSDSEAHEEGDGKGGHGASGFGRLLAKASKSSSKTASFTRSLTKTRTPSREWMLSQLFVLFVSAC